MSRWTPQPNQLQEGATNAHQINGRDSPERTGRTGTSKDRGAYKPELGRQSPGPVATDAGDGHQNQTRGNHARLRGDGNGRCARQAPCHRNLDHRKTYRPQIEDSDRPFTQITRTVGGDQTLNDRASSDPPGAEMCSSKLQQHRCRFLKNKADLRVGPRLSDA